MSARVFDGYETLALPSLDWLEAVYADPMYDEMGARIAELLSQHRRASSPREWVSGRSREHACAELARAWVASRLYRSVPEYTKIVDKRVIHDALEDITVKATGQRLSYRTPSAEQIRHFQKALASPVVLGELGRLLTDLAVTRAKELGSFPSRRDSNVLAAGDNATIYGDGTEITRYTNNRAYQLDGAWYSGMGQQVSGRSRHQPPSPPDSPLRAGSQQLNAVRFFTRTPFGRIHLGADGTTAGGEMVVAMDLADRVLGLLQGRVDILLYDTASTGWPRKHLMARYGVLLVTWPVKARATSSLEQSYRLEVEQALHRRGVDPARDRDLVEHMVQQRLARHPDELIPQGRSKRVSPTSQRVSWIDSTPVSFPGIEHRVGQRSCSHDLAVEDGQLWEVQHTTLGTHRIRPVRCEAAEVHGRKGLVLRLALRLVLDCPARRHEWTELWCPPPNRGRSTASSDLQHALDLYNPVNPHSPYWARYYRRSDAEAAQHELKSKLGAGGRAASVAPEDQLRDVLAVDCLTNTRTWHVSRLDPR